MTCHSVFRGFFLRLLQFSFLLLFVLGKDLILADMLSRSTSSPGTTSADAAGSALEEIKVHALGVLGSLVPEGMQQRLVPETARDTKLRGIMNSLSTHSNRRSVETIHSSTLPCEQNSVQRVKSNYPTKRATRNPQAGT